MATDHQDLLDAACRAGEVLADQLVAKNNELRTLRRVMWRALSELRTGRALAARHTLQQALERKHGG